MSELRSKIVEVLREFDEVRNIRSIADALESAITYHYDSVFIIPRELTDNEWSEVKYNVDRKADPDIELWRIKEAVKYANFIAGHRGRKLLVGE